MTQRHRDSPGEPHADDFLYHLYRGSELLADGRFDDSREELETALRMQPRDPSAQDLLARLYFRLGLYPRAIEIYQEIARQFPDRPSPRINLALAFLKTGQLRDVVANLLPVIERDPEHGRAWGYLGLAWWRLDEFAKAREAFLRAGHEGMARRMEQELEARHGASTASLTPTASVPSMPAVVPAPLPGPPPVPKLTPTIPPPAPAPVVLAQVQALDALDTSAVEPSLSGIPVRARTSLRPSALDVPGLGDAVAPEELARSAMLPPEAPGGLFSVLAGGELLVGAGAWVRYDDDALEQRSDGEGRDEAPPAARWSRVPDGWVLLPSRPGRVRSCVALRAGQGSGLVVRDDVLVAADATVLVEPHTVQGRSEVLGEGRVVLEVPAPGLRSVVLGPGGSLTLPDDRLAALLGSARVLAHAGGRLTVGGEGFALVALGNGLGHIPRRHG